MYKLKALLYLLSICLQASLYAQDPFCTQSDFISTHANWKQYQRIVLSQQTNIPGWCTVEKATNMMDLIYEVKPQTCVEIGVFGGSSIYPTACALKFLGQGKVYAIDPWKNSPCLEGYESNDPNYQWWGHVNLDKIYLDFLKMLNQFELNQYCSPMRMTALNALNSFADNSIDILHIDGNHTEENALQDAQKYLPKVKQGGYIWFDDVNWSTTRKAWQFLNSQCTKDEVRSTNEYFLFRKP